MIQKNKDRVRVISNPYGIATEFDIDSPYTNTIQFQLPNGDHIDISLTVEENALIISSAMDTMVIEPRTANVIRLKARR